MSELGTGLDLGLLSLWDLRRVGMNIPGYFGVQPKQPFSPSHDLMGPEL